MPFQMLNGTLSSPEPLSTIIGCHTAERISAQATTMAAPSPTWSPSPPQPTSPVITPGKPQEITWTLRHHPSSPGPIQQISPPRQRPKEALKHEQPSPAASLDAASWLHWPETLAHHGSPSPQQKPLSLLGIPPELIWQQDEGKLPRMASAQGQEAGSRGAADWAIPSFKPHTTAPAGMTSPSRDPGWALSWQVRTPIMRLFNIIGGKVGGINGGFSAQE